MEIDKAIEVMGPMFKAISEDASAALRELELNSDSDILDVGTGEAQFAICLALQGYDVLTGEPATDTSQYAGRDWIDKAQTLGVANRIRFQAFDASDIPFPENAFDAIFFFGALHHIDEALRDNVFREALRVMRPHGAVVFFEPKSETLEMVWKSDPDHPCAAKPMDYAAGRNVTESKITGSLMDIYIFQNVA